jgi:hypothetical protein
LIVISIRHRRLSCEEGAAGKRAGRKYLDTLEPKEPQLARQKSRAVSGPLAGWAFQRFGITIEGCAELELMRFFNTCRHF